LSTTKRNFELQAEELGLGTCRIGWFNSRKARRFLKIPRKYKIVSLMAVGYYEKIPPKEKKRKKLEEIAWFNRIEEQKIYNRKKIESSPE